MSSLTDIFSAVKNAVVALNAIGQGIYQNNPQFTSATVTAATLVIAGKGRLHSYTVVVAGSGDGLINDASTTGGAAAANALTPTIKTLGVYAVDLVFDDGLVIAPGTGQSINVTYSLGVG